MICFATPNWAIVCHKHQMFLKQLCYSLHVHLAISNVRLSRLETYFLRMGQRYQRVSVPMVPMAIPKDVVKLLLAPFDEYGILKFFSHYLVFATRRLLLSSSMFTIPMCPTCSSSSILFCSLIGIMRRIPHIRYPFFTESSCLRM